jgi:hypothetical protein
MIRLTALALFGAIEATAPSFSAGSRHLIRLYGGRELDRLVAGSAAVVAPGRWQALAHNWKPDQETFLARRAPFLLYPP